MTKTKTKTSLRLPFVMTVSVSAAAACGGNVQIQGEGDGGSGASSTTTATSGVGGAGTTAVSTSTGTVNPPPCPADIPNGYQNCDFPDGVACSYEVACQSGAVTLSFACSGGFWEVEPQPCAYPYDSCPGTELYCDGTWWMPSGTNPPSPCPAKIPDPGATCYPGEMGGDWEHCGYPCGAGDPEIDGWTVASCVLGPSDAYAWQHDGACD